jgi:hypothetical protein
MIAAMSPVQIGSPISPAMSGLGAMDGLSFMGGELSPDELAQLMGEIDGLHLAGLFVPPSDIGFGARRAS